jgi:hypothetical protein
MISTNVIEKLSLVKETVYNCEPIYKLNENVFIGMFDKRKRLTTLFLSIGCTRKDVIISYDFLESASKEEILEVIQIQIEKLAK